MKGGVITSCCRVKGMDGSKQGIGVYPATTVVLVDVCLNIISVPEALQEAQNLWSLGRAARTCLPNLLGEDAAFYESTVLNGDGEERGAVDFLPKIEAGLIPILSYVG